LVIFWEILWLKYKSIINDITYNNFNIQIKKPNHILNYHLNTIWCSTVLKDGRFVTGSSDNSIIIYNNKTFKPDLTIKEHSNSVNCIIQLSSGILASGSDDKTIKLYNINGNEYKVIQTLTYHTSSVYKIIELKNNQLVSCSGDKSIIFYFKDNNKYIKDYSISTNGGNGPVIQTKDNEIGFYEDNNRSLCFYDLLEKKLLLKLIILVYKIIVLIVWLWWQKIYCL
jgi:WD40 repeat protein